MALKSRKGEEVVLIRSESVGLGCTPGECLLMCCQSGVI